MHAARMPRYPPARIGFVGLGLLGASIALRVAREWPAAARVGVDRPDVARAALRRGVITDTRDDVDALHDCDLVVLATPVPAIVDVLDTTAAAFDATVVTDVGSTKRRIADAGRRLPHFAGGHPLAGAERGGLDRARPDLFDGHPWVIDSDAASDTAIAAVERFAATMGARPVRMPADEHDRVMAYVSHLPQLLAVALMNTAADAGALAAGVSGPAFAGITRLAASPGELWRGVIASNADNVAEALAALRRHLPAGEPATLAGDALVAMFERANRAVDAGKE